MVGVAPTAGKVRLSGALLRIGRRPRNPARFQRQSRRRGPRLLMLLLLTCLDLADCSRRPLRLGTLLESNRQRRFKDLHAGSLPASWQVCSLAEFSSQCFVRGAI